MTFAVKVDEVADPVPVRLLRAAAVASRADRAPQPIDQAFLPAVRRNAGIPSRFRAIAHPRSDNTANATLSNPNAVIRKGVDTPPNKTRYDIRRLNRLLVVRPRHLECSRCYKNIRHGSGRYLRSWVFPPSSFPLAHSQFIQKPMSLSSRNTAKMAESTCLSPPPQQLGGTLPLRREATM